MIPNAKGSTYLKIVESVNGTRIDHFLEKGKSLLTNGEVIAFQDSLKVSSIQFIEKGDRFFIKSFRGGNTIDMVSGEQENLFHEILYPLEYLQLYNLGSTSFVVPEKTMVGNDTSPQNSYQ